MAVLTPYSEDGYPLSLILQHRNSRSGMTVYIIVLLFLLLSLVSLPFIYIDISVRGKGVFHIPVAHAKLNAPFSGRVIRMMMKDNQKVLKGDTLMLMDASLNSRQLTILRERSARLKQFLKDIDTAVDDSIEREGVQFLTEKYRASWHKFIGELLERKNEQEQALKIRDRYKYLYDNKAVTLQEYEKFIYDYDQAVAGYGILKQRYRSEWETERTDYLRELKELQSGILEEEYKRRSLTILSPVNGSVHDLPGIQVGSYVMAGEKIAEISPDARLLAYCYIRPADIGLIRVGQPVSFQVDAFSYKRWGIVSGTVFEIPDDVIFLNNNEPVFRVKCTMAKTYLELDNGTICPIKKGMSFSARFSIAERSLFQLLYDSVEDWINPTMN